MQNDEKIQSTISFLTILYCIALVFISPSLTYAQQNLELHQKTLQEITKYTPSLEQNPHIPVGKSPSAMAVNLVEHKIYVVNGDDNTVSVIDGKNNTKIGPDIKVGHLPSAIAVDSSTSTIYVTNRVNGIVSVIDGKNNTKIGPDIKVGNVPSAMGFNLLTNTVYVTNMDVTQSL
jgi:YVTN family beta-propeller protein